MAMPWQAEEVVWDPFCGTAMELIECALAAPAVHAVLGTDLDARAISVAELAVLSSKDPAL